MATNFYFVPSVVSTIANHYFHRPDFFLLLFNTVDLKNNEDKHM